MWHVYTDVISLPTKLAAGLGYILNVQTTPAHLIARDRNKQFTRQTVSIHINQKLKLPLQLFYHMHSVAINANTIGMHIHLWVLQRTVCFSPQ